jgi:hypothetical protein
MARRLRGGETMVSSIRSMLGVVAAATAFSFSFACGGDGGAGAENAGGSSGGDAGAAGTVGGAGAGAGGNGTAAGATKAGSGGGSGKGSGSVGGGSSGKGGGGGSAGSSGKGGGSAGSSGKGGGGGSAGSGGKGGSGGSSGGPKGGSSNGGSGSGTSGGGGSSGGSGGAAAGTSGGFSSELSCPGDAGDPYADARKECVKTINMYRATLNLPPHKRWCGNATCEDTQSADDAAKKQAHSAFGHCAEFGQCECPGWGGAPFGAIDGCLKVMWDEGPGPANCGADPTCFEKHGHYLIMSSTSYAMVECGFAEAGGGWWGVQDYK